MEPSVRKLLHGPSLCHRASSSKDGLKEWWWYLVRERLACECKYRVPRSENSSSGPSWHRKVDSEAWKATLPTLSTGAMSLLSNCFAERKSGWARNSQSSSQWKMNRDVHRAIGAVNGRMLSDLLPIHEDAPARRAQPGEQRMILVAVLDNDFLRERIAGHGCMDWMVRARRSGRRHEVMTSAISSYWSMIAHPCEGGEAPTGFPRARLAQASNQGLSASLRGPAAPAFSWPPRLCGARHGLPSGKARSGRFAGQGRV